MPCVDRTVGCVERYLYKGDDHTFRLNVIDKSGNPVNIQGVTLTFTVKESGEDTAILLQKSSSILGEIDFADATNGLADIFIKGADTTSMSVGLYEYDIQMNDLTGNVITLTKGHLSITQDVTN